MKDHPFMFYQACIRPYSFYEPPLVEFLIGRDFVLDFVLLLTYHFIVVSGNFYLFLFLKSQTEKNTSLTGVDKKKERKRNLASAKTGIISGFVLVISIFVYSSSYGLKVFLGPTVACTRSEDLGSTYMFVCVKWDLKGNFIGMGGL